MKNRLINLSKATICLLAAAVILTSFVEAQRRKSVQKKPTPAQVARPDTKGEVPTSERSTKKNARPAADDEAFVPPPAFTPVYHYEFSQPAFSVSKITIEHDESGKGAVTFLKKGYDEALSDPIQLSPATLERINAALDSMNFLSSDEDYQFEKDYSHLGTMVFRLKRGSKSRTTRYNWTVNKGARALMDEYRKIGNQFIWMSDLKVARENQPLESPRLMDSLDSLMRRGEISDPKQMVLFLRSLTDDERLPLIARNHAGKLVKQIEKAKY